MTNLITDLTGNGMTDGSFCKSIPGIPKKRWSLVANFFCPLLDVDRIDTRKAGGAELVFGNARRLDHAFV